MPQQNIRRAALALILAAANVVVTASAQESAASWPSKPVMVVRINPPGGSSNEQAYRLWAEKLAASFGRPFIFDYRVGAAGIIGFTHVARAAADGYTYLAATPSFSVAPAFHKDLSFDVLKDFAAVSWMLTTQIVLIGGPGFPPTNFEEYIAYARANPGKTLWASSGFGSSNHLSGELLHSEIKASATFVQYKGGGPAIMFPDLLSGRVHVYASSVENALPQIRAGKFRPIVMLSNTRSPALPGVKTAMEQGYPEIEQPNYIGFVTRAGTNPAIIGKMSTELAKIAKSPDVIKAAGEGSVTVGSTPAEFGQYLTAQVQRAIKLVKEKNIRQE